MASKPQINQSTDRSRFGGHVSPNSNNKVGQTVPLRPVGKTINDTDARASILSQILLPEAADRLGRIRLVKESRATDVENRLIMLAKSGQLRSKVTEEQLKELLCSLAENTRAKEGGDIVVSRRKGGWEDEDDLEGL